MSRSLDQVLSGLDDVPWKQLQHAYGAASDVPQLIRDLAATNNKTRDHAWYELHGNLWHQGTIYEATAYAVPFLLKLLVLKSVSNRYELLLYLARLFNGRSYIDVHKDLKTSPHEVAKPDSQERLRMELSWVEATREAVRAGHDTYLKLLREGDRGLQLAAAHLLGLIGETDHVILETIAEIAER